jgi:hypothetical protein
MMATPVWPALWGVFPIAGVRQGNRSVTAGRDAALRRPDGAARRPYLSRPAVTDRLRGKPDKTGSSPASLAFPGLCP